MGPYVSGVNVWHAADKSMSNTNEVLPKMNMVLKVKQARKHPLLFFHKNSKRKVTVGQSPQGKCAVSVVMNQVQVKQENVPFGL